MSCEDGLLGFKVYTSHHMKWNSRMLLGDFQTG